MCIYLYIYVIYYIHIHNQKYYDYNGESVAALKSIIALPTCRRLFAIQV